MFMVSILGDSVSTFEGYNPAGYAVYYYAQMQRQNGLTTVYDTWWAKVNQALHAYLCVNNSFSGSQVSGAGFPSGVCEERSSGLHTPTASPDVILVYLGFNDFARAVPIRNRKNSLFHQKDPLLFEDAYDMMVKRLVKSYPRAKLVCGTLMRTRLEGNSSWVFPDMFMGISIDDYNQAIRRAVGANRCLLADLASTGIRYTTLDGTHPTAVGHREMASAWLMCLAKLL